VLLLTTVWADRADFAVLLMLKHVPNTCNLLIMCVLAAGLLHT
jgi:hypothetical protein